MEKTILQMAQDTKAARSALAVASGSARQDALNRMADKLLAVKDALFVANEEDLAAAPDLSPAFRKRLQINEKIFA